MGSYPSKLLFPAKDRAIALIFALSALGEFVNFND
jgi:hypothetical protein